MAPCVEYFGSVTGFVCVESTFFAGLVVVDTESSAVVFSFCPQSLISNEMLSHLSSCFPEKVIQLNHKFHRKAQMETGQKGTKRKVQN